MSGPAPPQPAGDLPDLLRRVREGLALSQGAAAARAGVQAQTVGRMERGEDVRLSTLSGDLGALGYTVELAVVEAATGAEAGRVTFPAPPEDAL